MKLNNDIQTGTILLVSNKNKSFLPWAIQKAEGSQWNHAGLIVKKYGALMVWEEGTIAGLVWTPLSEYLEREQRGEVLLQFANLKNYKPYIIENDIQQLCDRLMGRHGYSVKTILKQLPRQLLQRVGINWKWKSDPKDGFVCSGAVEYVLNFFFDCFPDWACESPDDLYCNDQLLFIQH
jgi:hypothetical protein